MWGVQLAYLYISIWICRLLLLSLRLIVQSWGDRTLSGKGVEMIRLRCLVLALNRYWARFRRYTNGLILLRCNSIFQRNRSKARRRVLFLCIQMKHLMCLHCVLPRNLHILMKTYLRRPPGVLPPFRPVHLERRIPDKRGHVWLRRKQITIVVAGLMKAYPVLSRDVGAQLLLWLRTRAYLVRPAGYASNFHVAAIYGCADDPQVTVAAIVASGPRYRQNGHSCAMSRVEGVLRCLQ
jgi:hypothetical protein